MWNCCLPLMLKLQNWASWACILYTCTSMQKLLRISRNLEPRKDEEKTKVLKFIDCFSYGPFTLFLKLILKSLLEINFEIYNERRLSKCYDFWWSLVWEWERRFKSHWKRWIPLLEVNIKCLKWAWEFRRKKWSISARENSKTTKWD